MDTLKDLIEQLQAERPGEDFALFGYDGRTWVCEFVNPVAAVSLGESSGVYSGTGISPEEAVRLCLEKVRADRK